MWSFRMFGLRVPYITTGCPKHICYSLSYWGNTVENYATCHDYKFSMVKIRQRALVNLIFNTDLNIDIYIFLNRLAILNTTICNKFMFGSTVWSVEAKDVFDVERGCRKLLRHFKAYLPKIFVISWFRNHWQNLSWMHWARHPHSSRNMSQIVIYKYMYTTWVMSDPSNDHRYI